MRSDQELITPKWKPDIYDELAIAQRSAVQRVLKVLNLNEDSNILDIGCGDGKISAELSKLAKFGNVLGIDASSDMIEFANSKYPYRNLEFRLLNAEDMNFFENFELIFSSFTLQWIKDKNSFFERSYNALKEGGQVCIICPLGVSDELDIATKTIIQRSEWSSLYQDFHPGWYFVDSQILLDATQKTSFKTTYSHIYIQEVKFSSKEDLEKYILLWYPYLAPLEKSSKEMFFSRVMEEYYKMLPLEEGFAKMRIPLLSFIASKINS